MGNLGGVGGIVGVGLVGGAREKAMVLMGAEMRTRALGFMVRFVTVKKVESG